MRQVIKHREIKLLKNDQENRPRDSFVIRERKFAPTSSKSSSTFGYYRGGDGGDGGFFCNFFV